WVREFLRRNPDGLVVHIGCGLDTRFERVDNGRVQWFDLDLPIVMDLRTKLLRHENPRYHALSASIFDDTWHEEIDRCGPRPKMFVAEGVLPYFHESEIKNLFLKLRDRFPGAELVCDAQSPFIIWADNLHLAASGVSARLHWGLRNPKDVESWGQGLRLIEEFYYYENDDPAMKPFRWVRYIPGMARSAGIYRYQLGA
ncbi:MAG TPA: class I SAM-dependent methyltransferase, partial [Anaerolineaceae bacterium]